MSDVFTDEQVELSITVSEMATDVGQVVRLDPTRVQEILDDYEDDKPQFPILRIEAGTVSGNGNNWPESLLTNIAEQINNEERPGYWGHIAPNERSYKFPDPETIWLGATVKNESGKQVLYVKGYNVPGGRARKHRRMAKVTSWAGKASGRVVNGIRNIESFALESIDWARPGSNGMSARVVAWATEMEGSEEMDFSKVTLADIERENPSLFELMRQRVQAETAAQVQEMKDKADKADEAEGVFAKLRKLLKIGDDADVVEAVAEAMTKVEDIGKGELRDRVAAVLTGKLKNEKAKSAVLRLFPVTEMVGKTDEEIKTEVESFLTTDDDAKAIVTEMEQAPAPLARGGRQNQGGDRSKVGGSGMVVTGVTKL